MDLLEFVFGDDGDFGESVIVDEEGGEGMKREEEGERGSYVE